jgi:hypothetical protein
LSLPSTALTTSKSLSKLSGASFNNNMCFQILIHHHIEFSIIVLVLNLISWTM